MTLPGNITFPVSLITETCCHYTVQTQKTVRSVARDLLTQYAETAVSGMMTDGTILTTDYDITEQRGVYCLQGIQGCREMIAQEQEVDLFGSEQNYGRTNSERRTD